MAENGKWTFSLNEEHWNNDSCDSREDAIELGREVYADDDVTEFLVGEIVQPNVIFDVDGILDSIDENFGEQCGEYADRWYASIKSEDIKLLQERVEAVVSTWMKETKNTPSFYSIKNSEVVNMIPEK